MPENKPDTSARRSKNKLTRQQIVQAAVDYADQHGIDKLSMRQLAGELECGAMSLYHHVSDKEELIDQMIDLIAEEIVIRKEPATQQNWYDNLRACTTSAYRVMLNHHWAPKYWGSGTGPAKNTYHENVLRILREAGFSEELACRGFHALTMHVVGFSMQALELQPIMGDKRKFRELGTQLLDTMSAEEYPYLVEHVRFHMSGQDRRNDFKYMLELILTGLQRDYDQGQDQGSHRH